MKRRKLISILLTIIILTSLYVLNEKYRPFEPGRYNKVVLSMRLINWNLRGLDEYPEHMIIYVRDVWEGDENRGDWHFYVGVYPSVDAELEKKIRALGYPYNYEFVHYESNDNFGARNGRRHPTGIDVAYWIDDYIYPDSEVHDWSYRTFFNIPGKRSIIHRLLYNPWRGWW